MSDMREKIAKIISVNALGGKDGFVVNCEAVADEIIAALPELQGWQPIETAPKDGTRILLWLEPHAISMPFSWRGWEWMGDDYPLNMAEPTHWMAMPTAPQALGIAQEGE